MGNLAAAAVVQDYFIEFHGYRFRVQSSVFRVDGLVKSQKQLLTSSLCFRYKATVNKSISLNKNLKLDELGFLRVHQSL